ncbi:MAG: hypothetical protein R3C46_13845 [Hyphomonadaceae bacterium]
MRDTAGALYRALQRDFSGSRIKLTGRAFDEANPDESVDEVSLDVWPSGEELADAISQFRQADAALAAAWQSLSEEEQEAVVDPREVGLSSSTQVVVGDTSDNSMLRLSSA